MRPFEQGDVLNKAPRPHQERLMQCIRACITNRMSVGIVTQLCIAHASFCDYAWKCIRQTRK